MGMVKYSQSSQNSKFAISLKYLKKEVRDDVDILHPNKHINIKVSYKLISYLTSMIKHSQSIQSGKFVISLQYLRKKAILGMEFCMQINIKSFDKLASSFLMELLQTCPKYPE